MKLNKTIKYGDYLFFKFIDKIDDKRKHSKDQLDQKFISKKYGNQLAGLETTETIKEKKIKYRVYENYIPISCEENSNCK